MQEFLVWTSKVGLFKRKQILKDSRTVLVLCVFGSVCTVLYMPLSPGHTLESIDQGPTVRARAQRLGVGLWPRGQRLPAAFTGFG